jgi:phytoene synthase
MGIAANEVARAPYTLSGGYDDCQRLARAMAGNFYYSFLVLPRAERRAMCALYTFFRLTDDLGDDDAPLDNRRQALFRWRQTLNQALAGNPTPDRWWLALADVAARFHVSPELFHQLIDGVESDLVVKRYATFAELYHYCFQVASTVGLACLRIWGVADRRAELPGEWCGLAFQLTNILRDISEDYRRGRIYLPLDELSRFGVREEELGGSNGSSAFDRLMRFQIDRAHDYYGRSAALTAYLPPRARAVFRVMTDIYRGLLRRIERRPAAVLQRRISLSAAQKLLFVVRALPVRFLPG